jgi:hypothetical protein
MLTLLAACKHPTEDSPVSEAQIPEWCPEVQEVDAGEGWSEPGHASGGFASYIVPTVDPEIIYVGAIYGGLYQSLDGGESWKLLWNAVPPHTYGQVVVDPANPARAIYPVGALYLWEDGSYRELPVGSLEGLSRIRGLLWNEQGLYALDQGGSFFYSGDGGESFEQRASLGTMNPPHLAMEGITSDYWHLAESEGVLLAVSEQQGLYRSTDDGFTWSLVWEGQVFGHTLVTHNQEAWVVLENSLYYSEDRGQSWIAVGLLSGAGLAAAFSGQTLVVADEQQLWFFENNRVVGSVPAPASVMGLGWLQDGLLLGHSNGLLKSDDLGNSWVDTGKNGFWDDNLSVLLAHPDCPGLVWAGTECQRGWFRSTDWGQNWENSAATYMHYVMDAALNPFNHQEIWVSTDDHVLRSLDLGESWEEIFPAMVHMHGLALDPFQPGRRLAGSAGSGDLADSSGKAYLTEDGGASWVDSSSGIPSWPGTVYSIAFSDQTEGLVFAATYRGEIFHTEGEGVGLYRSWDGGKSWEQVLTQEESLQQVKVCEGVVFALSDSLLYRSVDAGDSWEAVVEPWQYSAVECSSNGFFLRGYTEVWSSKDGIRWERLGEDLVEGDYQQGRMEDVAEGQGMVYATRNGSGVQHYQITDPP